MKRELNAGVHRALPHFVEVARENFSVRGVQVFGPDAAAEIHLEVLAAEMRDVLCPCCVALDGRLNARGIQILAAASDGAQRNAGIIEQLLEDFRRLLEVLRHVVFERLEPVITVLRGDLDTGLRMRLQATKLMPAHGVAHLVARERERLRSNRSPKSRANEFATSQHG
jgi:hypothetical protein